MKKSLKTAKPTKPADAKPIAYRPISEISRSSLISILGGKAALTFGPTALDGRANGWICKPDGTRIEKVLVNDIAEALPRAQQLLDRGAL